MNKLKTFITAAKAFIAQYELFTIPIFLFLAIFSLAIIEFVFRPDPAVMAPPNYETYHYFFRTCLIYVIVLALKWRWFKSDSPKSVERMKRGWINAEEDTFCPKCYSTEGVIKDKDNRELIFAYVKWFAYLFLFAFILNGVFP